MMTMMKMIRSNQAVDADVKVALSYVLMPLTFLMGVPWSRCRVVDYCYYCYYCYYCHYCH